MQVYNLIDVLVNEYTLFKATIGNMRILVPCHFEKTLLRQPIFWLFFMIAKI